MKNPKRTSSKTTSKLGVLFLHHTCDAITLNNLNSIFKSNPNLVINTMSAEEPIAGGYSLNDTPKLKQLHSEMPKRREDLLVCSWFLQKNENCEKWWIVEWDLFCEVSIREYYSCVWDYDFVASSVRLPNREPGWHWFQAIEGTPHEYRPFVMGALPFVFLMAEKALEATCKMFLKYPFFSGNSELRFATTANRCGYPPCGFSPPNDRVTWIPWNRLKGEKSIFHPVKHYVDYR